MPKKKEMTTEDLARMVKVGFDEVGERFDIMQADIDELKVRFETVEKFILSQHKHRIERLEAEVKNLKDLFALK